MHMKMFLNIFGTGIFQKEYRRQLWVTLSATLLTFSHGICIGWLAPMLPRLQSFEETPLDFVVNINEASWLGSLICVGGMTGNMLLSYLMNRFGRKTAIYLMAIPHVCVWILYYFAQSIEWLYVARTCAGITGGGMIVVLPIFIGEIADTSVRGRLCSLFMLTMNSGILVGFIFSTHLDYHVIPCVVVVLPLIYLLLATLYPETPQQLLRWGRIQDAQDSLHFYCNCSDIQTKQQQLSMQQHFDDMRQAVLQQSKHADDARLTASDFLNKPALRAIVTALVLMLGNIFVGNFAFINYMSNIFAAVNTQLDPNTNTIIIGAVQIVGSLASIYLVDRNGRKILLMASCAGSCLGAAAFGIYAFLVQETDTNLQAYSAWLPLCVMAFIIFVNNMGIVSVSLVVVVEILPQKIRPMVTTCCMTFLSVFAFISAKTFPLMMDAIGLAATMWLCATVGAFCLFYICIFLEETKGKPMYVASTTTATTTTSTHDSR